VGNPTAFSEVHCLGVYLICVAYWLQHSKEGWLAYLNHLGCGGELMIQLFFVLYGVLALVFPPVYYLALAARIPSGTMC
jgi:hypothetical protein